MATKTDNSIIEAIAMQLAGFPTFQQNLNIMHKFTKCEFMTSNDGTFDSEEVKRPNILYLQKIKSEGYSNIKYVSIKLCADDTYEVTFYKRGINNVESVVENVYCDELQKLVSEKIKMVLSLIEVTFS